MVKKKWKKKEACVSRTFYVAFGRISTRGQTEPSSRARTTSSAWSTTPLACPTTRSRLSCTIRSRPWTDPSRYAHASDLILLQLVGFLGKAIPNVSSRFGASCQQRVIMVGIVLLDLQSIYPMASPRAPSGQHARVLPGPGKQSVRPGRRGAWAGLRDVRHGQLGLH
jgi:hypothetical protein